MVYSLLFSLPGTPVLFYGEEIGMGEDLDAEGRLAVRTPMQWTAGRNGGFSRAAPSKLTRPVVEGGFSPEFVNVVPPGQFLPRYTFFTDPTYPETNLVVVRARPTYLPAKCAAGWSSRSTAETAARRLV